MVTNNELYDYIKIYYVQVRLQLRLYYYSIWSLDQY